MECILDAIGDDSVASVGATVEPSADVVVLREDIHKLSLAFIAPLRAEDDGEVRSHACFAATGCCFD